jgi:hypothetical protein
VLHVLHMLKQASTGTVRPTAWSKRSEADHRDLHWVPYLSRRQSHPLARCDRGVDLKKGAGAQGPVETAKYLLVTPPDWQLGSITPGVSRCTLYVSPKQCLPRPSPAATFKRAASDPALYSMRPLSLCAYEHRLMSSAVGSPLLQ